MLASLGILDRAMADPTMMRSTLLRMMQNWDWKNTWGWDHSMMAMTAARVGEGEKAIEALLMSTTKNTYLPNGHNSQMEHILPLYLPSNGGLLYAVAMMAAGCDGAPKTNAPGFPNDGNWTVRWRSVP
jgi:protein-glucosylgalactosylhydroxylysine glucosidase